jgi:hypothetical protein
LRQQRAQPERAEQIVDLGEAVGGKIMQRQPDQGVPLLKCGLRGAVPDLHRGGFKEYTRGKPRSIAADHTTRRVRRGEFDARCGERCGGRDDTVMIKAHQTDGTRRIDGIQLLTRRPGWIIDESMDAQTDPQNPGLVVACGHGSLADAFECLAAGGALAEVEHCQAATM